MSAALRPCSTCRRHVGDEPVCPFCGGALPLAPAPRKVAMGRLSRAAVFAGATLAGCWTGTTAPQQIEPHVTSGSETPHGDGSTESHEAAAAGAIEGTVTDAQSGAALSGVSVQLVSGGPVQSAMTDGQGHYRFDRLAPGTYQLRFVTASPNPRWSPARRDASVTVTNGVARVDEQLVVPTYRQNNSNIPMPYGAPPARRRIA